MIPSKTPGRQRLQQSNSRNHITSNAKSTASVKNKVNKTGLDFERNDYGQSNLLESHRQDTKMSQQPIESGDVSLDSRNVRLLNHQNMETRSAEEYKKGAVSLAEAAALSHQRTNAKAGTREGDFLKESSRKIPSSSKQDQDQTAQQ